MRKRIVVATLVAALVGSPWTAGTAWSKNDSLSRVHAYAGRLAQVLLKTDEQLLVRIVDATDAELMVTVGGVARTIAVGDLARVSIDGDSIKDGAIIGGLLGIPFGILGCSGDASNCGLAGVVIGPLFYGGIGALIDWRHHGRTVLYRAPGT